MGDPVGELEGLVRRRRMTRSFRSEPVDPAVVDRLVDLARRAPAAGNTDGLRFLVLDAPADVARYWDTTLPMARRAAFPWPGLLTAPVLVLPCVSAEAYVARYGEPDKAGRRAASAAARQALAEGPAQWPLPYWFVDGGMAVMGLLLGAEAVGLGALLFGLFEHEAAVVEVFGLPAAWRPVGVVALGWPAEASTQRVSRSARRGRRPLAEVVHRGRWPGP